MFYRFKSLNFVAGSSAMAVIDSSHLLVDFLNQLCILKSFRQMFGPLDSRLIFIEIKVNSSSKRTYFAEE